MAKPKLSSFMRNYLKENDLSWRGIQRMKSASLANGHSGISAKYRADEPYDSQIKRLKADLKALRATKKEGGWSSGESRQLDYDIEHTQQVIKDVEELKKLYGKKGRNG